MWTRESLIAHLDAGRSVDFLFFWGHTPSDAAVAAGRTDAACLSQWFLRPFEVGGVRYASAEHFMMAGKARLFRDDAMLASILEARSPAEAKAFGRAVRGFDPDIWKRECSRIVVEGNVAKFGQHEDLCAFLKATGRRVLVEASPRDQIWGIGMGRSNPDARVPARWRGQNLLGFALMEVRERLMGH
ncbi:MAG: NADAR family protein [Labilithrix sp.]|nr:NADAR family protein [Labilithrix sp.]